MKKPITYLIQVIVAILLVVLAREVVYIGIRNNKIGEYDKLNTIFLKENNFDLLFIGSSRTESHYNPGIFDSITGLSSYNIGLEAASSRMIKGELLAYLEHSEAPKYVVINIDFHNFRKFH